MVEVARYLLERAADVNANDLLGVKNYSILHYFCMIPANIPFGSVLSSFQKNSRVLVQIWKLVCLLSSFCKIAVEHSRLFAEEYNFANILASWRL